jgi:hypothetical protein
MTIAGKLGAVVILATLSPLVQPAHATPRYVGADKCKICHNRKDQDNQYEIWSNSGHAKAYATLATDQARELAAKAGSRAIPRRQLSAWSAT